MRERLIVFAVDGEEFEIPLESSSESSESSPSSESSEDSSSSESSDIAAFASPSTYGGSKYYTPENMNEGFYTPWGKSSFDIGLAYYKAAFGTVCIVALLISVMPYAIDFVRGVIDDFRDGMD